VQHTTELTDELAHTMLRHNARRDSQRRALLTISETLTREPGPALVSLADCLRWLAWWRLDEMGMVWVVVWVLEWRGWIGRVFGTGGRWESGWEGGFGGGAVGWLGS